MAYLLRLAAPLMGFIDCSVVFLVWRHHVSNDPCSFNIAIQRADISPSITKW